MKELHVGKSKFKLVNISAGKFPSDINGHSHSARSYEIHYCYEGNGTLLTNGQSYEIKRNTLYVTGPNVWHRQTIDKNNPMAEVCLYIQLVCKGEDQISDSLLGVHFWAGQGNETLKALFGALEALGEGKDFLSREKQVHIAELIVTELAGIYRQGAAGAEQDTPEDRKFVIIENAFLYEYDSVTLEGLAARLGMSVRQTQRILARYYGMAFREKKTAARLEAAYVLIQNGSSIGEASTSVGYSDAASFIRAFKKQYGTTPSRIGT